MTTSILGEPVTLTFPPFAPFQSLARLSRDMVVTEKIDGTNAQIHITEEGGIFAGSRTRWITPDADNFGFARWVYEHADELKLLGPGTHFGEWWGAGIQRKYGLTEKRFSLFNTGRWKSPLNLGLDTLDTQCLAVPVCHVVPVLAIRTFDTGVVDTVMERLKTLGSVAAPGFDKPEGVVVFHAASGQSFKKTLDKNDAHKGAA